MKIYNRRAFLLGLGCSCALLLFALEVIRADWWQWLFMAAIAGKFLYTGLSKRESDRQERIGKNYKRVSQNLLGRYAFLKINLPWLTLAVFLAVAIPIRYLLDVAIPGGITVAVLLFATASLFYSIGLQRQIVAQIEAETGPGGKAAQKDRL